MATIDDLKPKLSKLLPMLGSDNQNEAANAARMITNILKASKLDWHELVKRLFDQQKSSSNYYSKSSYEEYSNRYNQYSKNAYEEPKKKKKPEPDPEPDCSWRETYNGNYTGSVFGLNCTIFKSKRNPGLWDAVVNEIGSKTRFLHGFKTVNEAKKKLEFLYDPNRTEDFD